MRTFYSISLFWRTSRGSSPGRFQIVRRFLSCSIHRAAERFQRPSGRGAYSPLWFRRVLSRFSSQRFSTPPFVATNNIAECSYKVKSKFYDLGKFSLIFTLHDFCDLSREVHKICDFRSMIKAARLGGFSVFIVFLFSLDFFVQAVNIINKGAAAGSQP